MARKINKQTRFLRSKKPNVRFVVYYSLSPLAFLKTYDLANNYVWEHQEQFPSNNENLYFIKEEVM